MAKSCPYCMSLRSASLGSALLSLIFSMSMVTASATSLFYDTTMSPFVMLVFLVNGIANFASSVLCIRGICTESCHYLLPWIFTVSVSIIFTFLVSISYLIDDLQSYTFLGVILLLLSIVFSAAWICVLNYYFHLFDKRTQLATRNLRLTRRNAFISRNRVREDTSLSTIATLDDYRSAPPPYNIVVTNPVFEEAEDNKLPSYEEIFTKRSAGGVGANNNGERF